MFISLTNIHISFFPNILKRTCHCHVIVTIDSYKKRIQIQLRWLNKKYAIVKMCTIFFILVGQLWVNMRRCVPDLSGVNTICRRASQDSGLVNHLPTGDWNVSELMKSWHVGLIPAAIVARDALWSGGRLAGTHLSPVRLVNIVFRLASPLAARKA